MRSLIQLAEEDSNRMTQVGCDDASSSSSRKKRVKSPRQIAEEMCDVCIAYGSVEQKSCMSLITLNRTPTPGITSSVYKY